MTQDNFGLVILYLPVYKYKICTKIILWGILFTYIKQTFVERKRPHSGWRLLCTQLVSYHKRENLLQSICIQGYVTLYNTIALDRCYITCLDITRIYQKHFIWCDFFFLPGSFLSVRRCFLFHWKGKLSASKHKRKHKHLNRV